MKRYQILLFGIFAYAAGIVTASLILQRNSDETGNTADKSEPLLRGEQSPAVLVPPTNKADAKVKSLPYWMNSGIPMPKRVVRLLRTPNDSFRRSTFYRLLESVTSAEAAEIAQVVA